MPGIDTSVVVHRLNVSPSFPPIRQKKQVFAPKRDQAIAEEVRKLQEASFIKEVHRLAGKSGLHRPKQSMPQR